MLIVCDVNELRDAYPEAMDDPRVRCFPVRPTARELRANIGEPLGPEPHHRTTRKLLAFIEGKFRPLVVVNIGDLSDNDRDPIIRLFTTPGPALVVTVAVDIGGRDIEQCKIPGLGGGMLTIVQRIPADWPRYRMPIPEEIELDRLIASYAAAGRWNVHRCILPEL